MTSINDIARNIDSINILAREADRSRAKATLLASVVGGLIADAQAARTIARFRCDLNPSVESDRVYAEAVSRVRDLYAIEDLILKSSDLARPERAFDRARDAVLRFRSSEPGSAAANEVLAAAEAIAAG